MNNLEQYWTEALKNAERQVERAKRELAKLAIEKTSDVEQYRRIFEK